MSIKAFLLALTLLISSCAASNIMPDAENPIQMKEPINSANGQSLVFTFNIANTVNYNQFIGVVFPVPIATTDLNFDQASKFTCALKDSAGTMYTVTAVRSDTTENYIAHCRLDDTTNNVLKTTVTYMLTITLTNVKFTSNYVRTVGIFTSTTSLVNKLYIDSLPVFGTIATYGAYSTMTTRPFDIIATTVTPTSGPNASAGSGAIYSSNTFDIVLTVKVNSFITAADHYIVFRYPTTHVASPSSTVLSTAISATSTDTKQMALKSTTTLGLQAFGTNALLLTNIGEDLVPNRTFQLTLKGWKAVASPAYSSNTPTFGNLEVIVFYKNTYSTLSYSANSILQVTAAALTLTSAHPEGWDIFRSGAWPIKFTVSSNNDITATGFLLITHNNAGDSNKFNFIPSTCDFSDNTSSSSIDNSMGKRGSCYPYKLTVASPITNSVGSGFFFAIKGMTSGTMYYVTIWGYCDNCGNPAGNTANPNPNSVATVKITLTHQFAATYYDSLTATTFNDARFASSYTLGMSSNNPTVKCWNTKVQATGSTSTVQQILGSDYTATNPGDDIMHFREIFDWSIEGQTSATACVGGGTSCFANDIDVNNANLAPKFLYSTASAIASNTYFLITGTVTAGANDHLNTIFPVGVTSSALSAGKLVALFSRNWFTAGDAFTVPTGASNGCYLSWALRAGTAGGTYTQKQLLAATVPATSANAIAVLSSGTSTLDVSNSYASATLGYKISSVAYDSTANNFKYLPDAFSVAPATTGNTIAFFTSCIKWSVPTSVKSLYAYIDVQFQWINNSNPTRNLRFIKLYPEGGVFNDVTKMTGPTGAASLATFHYAYGLDSTSTGPAGVCLVQISSTLFSSSADTASNTVGIWITFGTLLESDYNDTTATYPAGTLGSGISAYSLQTGNPMSTDNGYRGTVTSTTYALPTIFTNSNTSFRTNYHAYMGSLLLLNGVTNGIVTGVSGALTDLLFPIYCPNYSASLPIGVSISSLSMTSYASMTQVNRIYGVGASAGSVATIQLITVKTTAPTGAITIVPATLRFAAYGATTSLDSLSVYGGNFAVPTTDTTANINCSGTNLLLSSAVTFGTTPTSSATGVNVSYTSTKNYYAVGKMFNKALLATVTSVYSIPVLKTTSFATGASPTAAITYTGLTRPVVTAFAVSTSTSVVGNTNDIVGFFCSSSAAADNSLLTNLVSGYYVLDWNTATTSQTWTASYISDKSEAIYKNDVSSNVRLSFTLPAAIPAYSVLSITSANNAFSAATICGITTALTNIVSECTNTSGVMTCTAPSSGTSYIVCCYTTTISDTFSLSTVSINLPVTNTSGAVSTSGIWSSTLSSTSWSTSSSTAVGDLQATTFSAKISSFSYLNINQDTGIGRAVVSVTLPRELPRNAKITITGDFTSLAIPNYLPRCVVTTGTSFGQSWDSGDAFIETCSTASFASTSGTVVITTKNLTYKCGLALPKTLTVYLWPVQTYIWTSTSTQTYKVTMQINSSGTDSIYNSQAAVAMPTTGFSNVAAKPGVIGQWETLCAPTSINPKIPGAYSEYVFSFDLDTGKAALATLVPNELSIFFPYQYYGSNVNNVLCYYKSALVNCSFYEEGRLGIRFASGLPVGSGSKILISVVGIMNPGTENDLYFPCTVDNNTFTTGSNRQNLITGSGKLAGGITYNTNAPQGNLRFLTPITTVTDTNPRDVSQHTFRVTFDSGVNQPALGFTIANTPQLIITFPADYNLAWFASSKASISIDEYTSDVNNVVTSTPVATPTVTQMGNKITATFSTTTYTFNANWRYWDIKVAGITGPSNATSQATALYDIILTNSDFSSVYRTFTNLNSLSGVALTTPIDANVSYNRGYQFTYDNTKFVVNVSSASSTAYNMLTINSGRFVAAYFNVATNTSATISNVTNITLVDPIFKTSQSSYSVASGLYQPMAVSVGAPCGTIPGSYVINFSSSNSGNYAVLTPVSISVVNTSPATIAYQNPSTVPAGGSTWIGIYISESNVDALTVKWTGNKNDASANISQITIPSGSPAATSTTTLSPMYSVFTITNSAITTSQQFTAANPNACYQWSSNSITINISSSATLATVASTTDLSKSFVYASAATDATITAKNTIKFTFTPPVYPVYLYCALTCSNVTLPTDAQLPTVSSSSNTALLQYYTNFVNSATAFDILYTGLVRGQQYHMKCLIQSTQGDSTQRGSVSYSIENGTLSNTTVVPITPPSSIATQCVQYVFTTDPGNSTKVALVNYCQRLFSSSGYASNGCVVCTSSDASYVTPGLSLPVNVTCTAAAVATNTTKSSLRFLDGTDSATVTTTATNTTNMTNTTSYVTYSVCAVPYPICATDPNVGGKAYSDLINTLSGLTTSASIASAIVASSTMVIPINSTSTFGDTSAPNMTFVTAAGVSANANGLVTWTSQTSSGYGPYVCYWKIQPSTSAAPAFSDLTSCTSSWCGKTKANTLGVSTSTNTQSLTAFTAGTSYNIYYGCYNDIPSPQMQSSVSIAGTFNIASSNSNTGTTNSSTNGSTNGTTPASSNFVNFSMMAVLMVLALIFN